MKTNYAKREIFQPTPTSLKVNYPPDKEPIKCYECEKILISHKITDINYFWVKELECKKCGSNEKGGNHICSSCYLAKLEAGDPIITKDFNTYHKW